MARSLAAHATRRRDLPRRPSRAHQSSSHPKRRRALRRGCALGRCMSCGGRSAPTRCAAKALEGENGAKAAEERVATAGLQRPVGWRASAEQRLAAGHALGTLALRPQRGALLHVRRGPHGRSLHAAEFIAEGAYICCLRGELCCADPRDEAFAGREKMYVSKARDGEPPKFLLLRHPTAAEPGNLCNTAGGRGANNAKLARRNGSVVASVYATRDIAPGDEILVPYGAGYTRELRERAGLPEPPEEPAGEAQPWAYNLPQRRPCPCCSKRMLPKQLARHVGLGNCRRTAGEGRRSSSQQSTRASATPRTRSATAA